MIGEHCAWDGRTDPTRSDDGRHARMDSFMGRTATLGSQRFKLPFLFYFWNFTAPGLFHFVFWLGLPGAGGPGLSAYGWTPATQAVGSWDKS